MLIFECCRLPPFFLNYRSRTYSRGDYGAVVTVEMLSSLNYMLGIKSRGECREGSGSKGTIVRNLLHVRTAVVVALQTLLSALSCPGAIASQCMLENFWGTIWLGLLDYRTIPAALP